MPFGLRIVGVYVGRVNIFMMNLKAKLLIGGEIGMIYLRVKLPTR